LLPNIFISDAHFHLHGANNERNFRYWAGKNTYELPFYDPKFTVWCVVSSVGVSEPYFFDSEDGPAVSYVRLHSTEIFMLRAQNLPGHENL